MKTLGFHAFLFTTRGKPRGILLIKIFQMATIKIVLRKDKVNKKTGLAPIYIRIIKDRKSKFLSLGVKVEPRYWNEEKSAIRKGAATNAVQIVEYLTKKFFNK